MKFVTYGKTKKVLMLDGETLFNQGDKGDHAYMIVHGLMDVVVDGKKVGAMRDGELFGEMALILNQNRSATIISNKPTELISINKENFDELLSSASESAKQLIIELCKELSKRSEFQNVNHSRAEIDEILKSENELITKITKQIFYRLERSTDHTFYSI